MHARSHAWIALIALAAGTSAQAAGRVVGSIREDQAATVRIELALRLDRLVGDSWITQTTQVVPAGSSSYAIEGLPAGVYRLSTVRRGLSYINLAYGGVECAADDCSPAEIATATPFLLATDQTWTLNELRLRPAGSLRACVQDVRGPAVLPGVQVVAYSAAPFPVVGYVALHRGRTDANGCVTLEHLAAAPTGMRLRTLNNLGFVDQIFGGSTCAALPCDLGGGSLIPLAHDQDLDGFTFGLSPGASISGTLRLRAGGTGVANATVLVENAQGQAVREADQRALPSGANGSFATVTLPDGAYTLRAEVREGNLMHSYAYPGNPVTISQGNSVTGIEWVLEGELFHADGFESP